VPQTPPIAIVDDDASVREAIQALLKASGFCAEAFLSAEDFLRSDRLSDATCLILDVQLRGMSGMQLQEHLSALGSSIPIIIVTAFPGNRQRALAAGALGFLDKPFHKEELLRYVRSALDLRSGGDAAGRCGENP
jgi:FixJ family two-component response regulator